MRSSGWIRVGIDSLNAVEGSPRKMRENPGEEEMILPVESARTRHRKSERHREGAISEDSTGILFEPIMLCLKNSGVK
jgi:hypothetical protein